MMRMWLALNRAVRLLQLLAIGAAVIGGSAGVGEAYAVDSANARATTLYPTWRVHTFLADASNGSAVE